MYEWFVPLYIWGVCKGFALHPTPSCADDAIAAEQPGPTVVPIWPAPTAMKVPPIRIEASILVTKGLSFDDDGEAAISSNHGGARL